MKVVLVILLIITSSIVAFAQHIWLKDKDGCWHYGVVTASEVIRIRGGKAFLFPPWTFVSKDGTLLGHYFDGDEYELSLNSENDPPKKIALKDVKVDINYMSGLMISSDIDKIISVVSLYDMKVIATKKTPGELNIGISDIKNNEPYQVQIISADGGAEVFTFMIRDKVIYFGVKE